jgi:hypothetical protein
MIQYSFIAHHEGAYEFTKKERIHNMDPKKTTSGPPAAKIMVEVSLILCAHDGLGII